MSSNQLREQHKDVVEVTVCCGCRPKATSNTTKWKRHKKKSPLNPFQSKTRYYDADEPDEDYRNFDDDESLCFFDAVENPLHPEDYPPSFTTSVKRPKPVVTLEDPTTLLRHKPSDQPVQQSMEIIPMNRKRSIRFERIASTAVSEHTKQLQEPRIRASERGFPGGLSLEELAECQKFLRGLKLLDEGVLDQVYSFRDVEEEPYTICRWLRATKFSADDILKRLEENQPMFEEAQQNDFYPDPSETLGAPVSVFLSQYPFLPIGSAKNGCPVNYFKTGKIHPEGIFSMTTVEKLKGYFWWTFMWKFKREMRRAQAKDPDFVRVEGVNILDLKGLSSSAVNSETMDVLKLSSKIADFFPETLHCMLILNAPGFFSLAWKVIKKLIDARTAARIQVFSSEEKGLKALQKLVDLTEIPKDYGGSNISIDEAFTIQAADPALVRQHVELLHAKKGKNAKGKQIWKAEDSEFISIKAYTRSVSVASISVLVNGQVFKTVQTSCAFAGSIPEPTCIHVCNVDGPATVTIEITDLDTAKKEHQGMSRGYILFVGDIKRS